MTTTYSELKTAVAQSLGDPDLKTFTSADIGDFINAALAEVGRIAPTRFQEDIDITENAMSYVLRSNEFDGEAVPEIEVQRVEIWDGGQTPARQIAVVMPADGAYTRDSESGWKVWDGVLELPRDIAVFMSQRYLDDGLIRVWGYSPYPPLVDDEDVVPVSNEREWALRTRVRIEALQRLIAERDLFTQWQTRAGNTDVTPAALMNGLNIAMEDWRRLSRQIAVLREAPG